MEGENKLNVFFFFPVEKMVVAFKMETFSSWFASTLSVFCKCSSNGSA